MSDEGQKAIEAATDQLVVRLETLFQWELNREHGRTFTRHIIRAYLAALSGWPIWLIYSREHNAFWRPNSSGYTWDINAAGRYTHEEAVARCNTRDMQHDGSPSEVCMIAPEMLLSPPGLED